MTASYLVTEPAYYKSLDMIELNIEVTTRFMRDLMRMFSPARSRDPQRMSVVDNSELVEVWNAMDVV
jgi:hypothetical protein